MLRNCVTILIFSVLVGSFANAQQLPVMGTKTGEMYPDFVLPTVDGEVRQLSDYRGKPVLLFHFASW